MSEPEFHEMPAVSEVFGEAAQAVIRALGRPDAPTVGVFACWIGVDPSDGEIVLAASQTVEPGWSNRAGSTDEATAELRALVRHWLDLADSA